MDMWISLKEKGKKKDEKQNVRKETDRGCASVRFFLIFFFSLNFFLRFTEI